MIYVYASLTRLTAVSMRDNHNGMPEFISAFEEDDHYFAVIEIILEDVAKRFRFGISRKGYLALKNALQLHPFDAMPGLKYRYFYNGSCKPFKTDIYSMNLRIELNRNATSSKIEIPQDLHANLLWFSRLQSFDEALYLEQNNQIAK